jgi:hypothetical protein
MRVLFSEEALADPELSTELDRIVDKVDDGWHLWEVPNPDAVEESAWFEGARPRYRELFEGAARGLAWQGSESKRQSGPHQKRVIVNSAESQESQATSSDLPLTARAARRFLSEPLRIVMENIESDGVFLDAVFDALGPGELHDLRKCEPPALCYDSPGGNGEIPKRVRHYINDSAWRDIPRRLFVLTDSDRLEPQDSEGAAAKSIRRQCEKTGLPCHVLRKRTIENYVPQQAIDAWAEKPEHTIARDMVAALTRLNEDQRNYFPMKEGLKGQNHSADLFSPSRISQEDRELLSKKPFGRDVVRFFRDRTTVTAETLRQRCGPLPKEECGDDVLTELDELVARICAQL